jgi:hypothetical protein
MAWFVGITGAIIVGLAYLEKRRFHKEMEAQRRDEKRVKLRQ